MTRASPAPPDEMADILLDRLLHGQAADGAFPSTVAVGDRRHDDANAFVTALILEELGAALDRLPAGAADPAIARGLDFLERCASPDLPGAFHFYPPDRMPAWLGTTLPADADDTALVLTVLLRFGRRTAAQAGAALDRSLHPWRLHHRPDWTDPWIRQGAYRTWLDRRAEPNPVDACVNANVATLFAAIGRDGDDACRAARDTVLGGLEFAARNPAHRGRLTPFYPDPLELAHALRRGARRGVTGFAEAAEHLEQLLAGSGAGSGEDSPRTGRPVFGSADGRWLWTAPLLQTARALTRALASR